MTYTSLENLDDKFGTRMLVKLTDRAEVATGLVDSDVVDRALADTDGVINGYLAKRYQLPLDGIPDPIGDLALAICIYKLHVTSAPDKIKEDYRDALRMLKDLSEGIMRLDAAGIEPASKDGKGVQITDRERPLTEATMKGFI